MEFLNKVGGRSGVTKEELNSDTSGEGVEVFVDCSNRVGRLGCDDELSVECEEVTLDGGELERAEIVDAFITYFRFDGVGRLSRPFAERLLVR